MKLNSFFVCLLKTLFLLTLQYLEFCDQTILLEDGKICEKGIHSELIQKKGRYAQLIQKMHGEAIQVISNPPHSHSWPNGEDHPLHPQLVFSPQGVFQGIAKAAEELQVEGRAQTTCPEERLNENAGKSAGEQSENLCLPASSRGPGISSWMRDQAMSLIEWGPRHHTYRLQIQVSESCGEWTVLVRRPEMSRKWVLVGKQLSVCRGRGRMGVALTSSGSNLKLCKASGPLIHYTFFWEQRYWKLEMIWAQS